MLANLCSIRNHNLFGNVVVGVLLLALGIAHSFAAQGIWTLICSALLLVVACISLFICVSGKRECEDEMSLAYWGVASSRAFMATLIVIGLACVVGMTTGMKVSLASAGCTIIGFALIVYGLIFAHLER